jgi:uncharacterized protein YoxC
MGKNNDKKKRGDNNNFNKPVVQNQPLDMTSTNNATLINDATGTINVNNSVNNHPPHNDMIVGLENLPAFLIPLFNENKSLRHCIDEKDNIIRDLNRDIDSLRAERTKNWATIKELENDNKKYKDIIDELTEKNRQLEEKIKNLEKQIDIQNTTIDCQNSKIADLEGRLLNMETKELFNKYVLAYQDLNSRYMLETKLNNGIALKSLKKLRNNRNGECHYCLTGEPLDYINSRFYAMNDKIKKIPVGVRNMFEKKYPGLINEVNDLFDHYVVLTDPDPDLLEDAFDWWEE